LTRSFCAALVVPGRALLAAAGLLVTASAFAQQPAARVALVIGNADYKSAPLKNPVNDARAVSRALKELGFDVLLKENVSQQGFVAALREFGALLKNPEATGLFYYAGHGMQVKNANYLIPVDAAIEGEDEIRYMALDANQVLDKMEQAGNRLNIVILDACRDNPFARSFRSKQTGLAQMDAPSGMLVAFATAPGAVAYDGEGVNGVYTKHLLRNLGIPGLPVELVLKRVREGVSTETGGKQIPWESSSLLGDFYFKSAAVQSSVPVAPDAAALELAFWNAVKDSGAAGEYRAYLEKYPNGQFAALAKERMNHAVAQDARKQRAETPPQAALAQPGAVQPSPPRTGVQVGDVWTYELLLGGKRRIDEVNILVVGMDGNRVWEEVSRGTQRSGAIRRMFRTDFDAAAPFQETRLPGGFRLIEFSPYLGAARLPARGTEWKGRAPAVSVESDSGVYTSTTSVTMSVKVVGPERIRVPLGEFDTTRIDAMSVPVSGARIRVSYWYTPTLQRAVKLSYRVFSLHNSVGADDVLELSSVQAVSR
jgi:hypothetical protein